MKRVTVTALAVTALWSANAMATEVKVLSGGAVEPGLHKATEAFKRATGHDVKIQFNTTPQIAKRLQEGYITDVVIAPPGAMKQHAQAGKVVADGHVPIGKVGAGIVIRPNAPVPNIATTDALKASVLAADSIVYNTASSGIYLEQMFDKLGIGAQIKGKTTRHANGDAVMEHVIKGKGSEIGFGAITEIKLYEAKGTLKLVGPLPSDVQNYTSYSAGLSTNAPAPDAGKAFIAFLATPAAKQLFAAVGIE